MEYSSGVTSSPSGSANGLSVLLSAAVTGPLDLDPDFGDLWNWNDTLKEPKIESDAPSTLGCCSPIRWSLDGEVKEEGSDGWSMSDSAGNSPSSLFSLEDETSLGSLDHDLHAATSFSSYALPDPTATPRERDREDGRTGVVRRPVMVRKRMRECSMVCWLFRTLLTSEYRALPLNAIFEIFEDTNPSSAHGRHWRQSIRHCLMSSAVFVRVLTPNPRKDFLVMNEAGSWWTVHPDCETTCAEDVFRPGLSHRCPPNAGSALVRMKMYRVEDGAAAQDLIYREAMPEKWKSEKIFAKRRQPLHERPKRTTGGLLRNPASISLFPGACANPSRGDHLVVDHEEVV